MFRLSVVLVLLGTGCSMFDSGGQTAAAVSQNSELLYTNDKFSHITHGSQEAKLLVIEVIGSGLKINSETGDLDFEASENVEQYTYISSDPTGKAATNVSGNMASLAGQQSNNLLTFGQGLISLVGEIRGGQGGINPPSPGPTLQLLIDRLDRLLLLMEDRVEEGDPG